MKDTTILITGSNRGIGAALVEEALKRGVTRVYAAARNPRTYDDPRVTPLQLDITSESQVRAAAASVDRLDVLINNAGVAILDDLSERGTIEEHLRVNLFGTHGMMHAFLPHLKRSHGAFVNVLSMAAFVGIPISPAYSVSKAAAFSLSQNMRSLLAPAGVRVHIVLPGPIDTDMSKPFDVPKATPQAAASEIFDGLARGDEEIFPDPMSASVRDYWNGGAFKEMERQYAGMVS